MKQIVRLGVLGLACGLALVPAAQALSATFYLAPTGDDAGDGSEAQPFFTLARAWQEVEAGDTVYLRGGTYAWSEQQYLQGRSGAQGMMINVWAVPGETPTLTMAADYSGQDLIYFEGDFVHWRGLEFADFWPTMPNDFGWPAFRSGASNDCVYERLDYHHNRAGLSLRGASNNNLILNSDFHHNADPADNYDGTDGLDLHFIDAGVSNTIRGCRAYWNGDDGFDLWSNNGHVLIEDSWAFFNGFIPDTFEEAGNGSGFKLGTANPSSELLREVHNNLSYRNRAWGFVENDALIAMHLFNNTSAQNGGRNFWFGDWGCGRCDRAQQPRVGAGWFGSQPRRAGRHLWSALNARSQHLRRGCRLVGSRPRERSRLCGAGRAGVARSTPGGWQPSGDIHVAAG